MTKPDDHVANVANAAANTVSAAARIEERAAADTVFAAALATLATWSSGLVMAVSGSRMVGCRG